jgi:hypothetical protein
VKSRYSKPPNHRANTIVRAALQQGTKAALAATLLTACSAAPDLAESDSDPAVDSVGQEFIGWDNAQTYLVTRINQGSTVRICLTGGQVTTATRPALQTTIRTELMKWVTAAQVEATHTLMSSSGVVFTCSSPDVNINWSSAMANNSCALGTPGCTRANAGFGYMNLFNGNTAQTVLHEFGHVFGIGDTYSATGPCVPGQPNSVMCGFNGIPTELMPDDTEAIQQIFAIAFPGDSRLRWRSGVSFCSYPGAQLFVGDFNGDGLDDMLCHDKPNGNKAIMRNADNWSAPFTGTTWSSAMNWCGHSTGQLLIGDFNGDGRDDMLCHDTANGNKWVSLATTSGTFTGTSSFVAMNWCNHADGQLLVGDFDGNGRADLLCHDRLNGNKWVALSNSSGSFTGTSSSVAMNWCRTDGDNLHVGDFDGNGRDDLLCHNALTGAKSVARSNSGGTFSSATWTNATMNWCSHVFGQLHIGDFDNDGRDDMLCHDVNDGTKWMAMATSTGTFEGTTRENHQLFCYAPTAVLRVGDFNRERSDDFFCHYTNTAGKEIAYQ